MNDQPQPEKIRRCLEASLKKDMKAGGHTEQLSSSHVRLSDVPVLVHKHVVDS